MLIPIFLFFQFSASVEKGLKDGFLNSNQLNEFNRDICNAIKNSFTSNRGKAARQHIAKMVINKYPCLADKADVPGASKWL